MGALGGEQTLGVADTLRGSRGGNPWEPTIGPPQEAAGSRPGSPFPLALLELEDLRSETVHVKMPKRRRRLLARQRARLTVQSGYRIAILHNIGHGSQKALVDHCCVDLTRQSRAKWETNLSACLVVASRAWYDANYKYIASCCAPGGGCPDLPQPQQLSSPQSWAIHTVRGDGTNS
eukprot:206992-Alexandrium_andersonii.AAC.1